MRGAVGTLVLAALLGCESDTQKYDRLNTAMLMARSAVRFDESQREQGKPVCPELAALPTNEYLAACNKRVLQHQTEYALRLRDLNRFMSR